MNSLDLNRLVKEADLLKMTAEILEGSDANVSGLCYKAMVQVEEMKEGLQTLKILLDKQKDQIETCKVW
jgi:transcriptional regulator